MATWKKIIVSGSQAHLAAVTASLGITVGAGTGNQVIGTDQASTQLTGSFTGSFTGTFNGSIGSATSASYLNVVSASAGTPGNAHYITFVDSDNVSGLYEQFYTDGGITYTPSTDLLTISGDVAVNGGDVTTTATTATVFNANATTLNIGGAATTITIGATPTATTTVRGGTIVGDAATQAVFNTTATTVNAFGAATAVNIAANSTNPVITLGNGASSQVVIPGDLIVNGNTTTINTTNLYVEDKFILLNSGSAANDDGGILVDRGSDASGNMAFGYNAATRRWGYQNGLLDTTNALDPTSNNGVSGSFAGVVFTEASHGATKPVTGEFAVLGAIYTATNEDIWIYS